MPTMKRLSYAALVVFVLLMAAAGQTRNPFGVPDISDATGDDVLAHLKRAVLDGGDKDPNAAAWPREPVDSDPMKIDGTWAGRWNSEASPWSGEVATKVAKRGDRLFILHGGYLIEAIRQPDGRYAGRWVSVGSTSGGGTWVGRIVSEERIDGDWVSGRWDFRRRFE
jgi:hypothetical protein